MEKRAEIAFIATRCGTCEHKHQPGSCPDCAAGGMQCPGWTQHPDDKAREQELEHADIASGGVGLVLDSSQVRSLLDTLAAFEARIDTELGWDSFPILATVGMSAPPVAEHPAEELGYGEQIVMLAPLQLPDLFWKQSSVMSLLYALTRKAAEQPDWWRSFRLKAGIQSRDPALAWVLVTEAWAKDMTDMDKCAADDPSLRRDEIRTVSAVDIDGRVYSLARLRSTGEVVQCDVHTGPNYRRMSHDILSAAGLDPYARLTEEGLDRAHTVCSRLAVLSRQEIEQYARVAGPE